MKVAELPERLKTPVWDLWPGQFAKQYKGDFGIEIEVEGRNIAREIQGWRCKPDGSLRGESMEYVFRDPASDQALLKRVKTLEAGLSGPDVEVFDSHRTSTHIHLNFLNNPVIDVFGYWVAFTILEPLLLRTFAPSRDGNLFCLPSYDCDGPINTVMQCFQNLTGQRGWPDNRKYSSLNLSCLPAFGSVECRIFPCTIKADLLLTWCDILKNLRDLSSGHPDKTFYDMVNLARTHPGGIIWDTMGKTYCTDEAEALVAFGCEQAFEISRALSQSLKIFEHDLRNYPAPAAAKKHHLAPNHVAGPAINVIHPRHMDLYRENGWVEEGGGNIQDRPIVRIHTVNGRCWSYYFDHEANVWRFV